MIAKRWFILFALILNVATLSAAAASAYWPAETQRIMTMVQVLSMVTILLLLSANGIRIRPGGAGEKSGEIASLLSDLTGTDSAQEAVEKIVMMPTGHAGGKLAAGWNRLIELFRQMHEEVRVLQIEKKTMNSIGQNDSHRYAGIFNHLPDGILLLDTQGTVVMANRCCEGMIGIAAGDMIGKNLFELIKNEEALRQFELFRLGKQGELQFETNEGEGESRRVTRFYCGRLGRQQEALDYLLLLRDVTQQKVAENAQDDFIAHVSHELRTPLTNIRAYAETLLSDMVLDASAQKEAFNVINEETIRLTHLINQVLDLSRMESGSMKLDRGEVVMDRLIRQCVNDIKAMAASKSITVQTNYHPKMPNLYADREKLAVVYINILSNAIKYTPEGGTVFVETNVDDNFVYVKITDTGYGIAPEHLDKIFEKFFRVEREETATITGSGLGLATSREIVMLHGGTINVTSQLNTGTEMLVKMPQTKVGPVLGPGKE